MKLFLALFFLTISYTSILGQVSCEELIEYVEDEGYVKGTVSSIKLIDSSWLKEVKAYSIENTIVVIAKIKKDKWAINSKKYIFCGISSYNWNAFFYGLYDIGKTYGERFHKYIYDNKCKCY